MCHVLRHTVVCLSAVALSHSTSQIKVTVVAAVVELTVKMFEDPGLLTREDLLVAMDNLKKSALKVKRTPCILVNDGKG